MGQPEDLRCSVQYLQANAGTVPTLFYNHLPPHFSNTSLQILQIFPPNREPPRRPPSHVFIQLVAGLKRPGHKTSGIVRLKRDGTRAETRFRLSPKRTSPFKSVGAAVQSTAGSRGVCISGSHAGYTTFRGSVRVLATHSIRQFPLHFPSHESPCAIRFQTHSTNVVCECQELNLHSHTSLHGVICQKNAHPHDCRFVLTAS